MTSPRAATRGWPLREEPPLEGKGRPVGHSASRCRGPTGSASRRGACGRTKAAAPSPSAASRGRPETGSTSWLPPTRHIWAPRRLHPSRPRSAGAGPQCLWAVARGLRTFRNTAAGGRAGGEYSAALVVGGRTGVGTLRRWLLIRIGRVSPTNRSWSAEPSGSCARPTHAP